MGKTSSRKFYGYTITIQVFSDAELSEDYLQDLVDTESLVAGDIIATAEISEPRVMDAVEAAKAALAAQSDPEFFGLTADGEELYED